MDTDRGEKESGVEGAEGGSAAFLDYARKDLSSRAARRAFLSFTLGIAAVGCQLVVFSLYLLDLNGIDVYALALWIVPPAFYASPFFAVAGFGFGILTERGWSRRLLAVWGVALSTASGLVFGALMLWWATFGDLRR